MSNVLNVAVMEEIAEQSYANKVQEAYGDRGLDSLREILGFLRRLYESLDPELLDGPLTVFAGTPSWSSRPAPAPYRTRDVIDLAQRVHGRSLIVVTQSGDLEIWTDIDVDPAALSTESVVYLFETRADFFLIRGSRFRVLNPLPVHASVFAIPAFMELKEALARYKSRMIRSSTCDTFATTWSDQNRLFFVPRPEAIMRRSLTQYLRHVLRDAVEVRPEQNVDDRHPVDIKVTWALSTKLALIEIKWLGKSRNKKGRVTATFSDARARRGARQLADYLDANRTHAPTHTTRAYLVVIDARRRRLNASSVTLARPLGFYYEQREITYAPAYHNVRPDFDEPVRMFAEPLCP